MDKKIRWLRIAYWTAAIADFIIAILVLVPSRMGLENYVYPMGLMSSVAFSWGVMLILASKHPVKRRWILIPTILVVALLGVTGLHAGFTGLLTWIRIIPVVIVSLVVLGILNYAYFNSRDLI